MPSTVKVSKPTNKVGTFKYSSPYANQLKSALNTVTNWSYDPTQDASYQALARVYNERGNRAAADTLGQAASLNGGYGTSYAVTAAQQARNQYNQEFAAQIPELEQRAYDRANTSLSALREADNTKYQRYADTYANRYQRYRDKVSDYQWGKGYNVDVYTAKKSNSSGGGGRSSGGRGSSGGGGYYSGSGGTADSGLGSIFKEVAAQVEEDKKKKNQKTVATQPKVNTKPKTLRTPPSRGMMQ